ERDSPGEEAREQDRRHHHEKGAQHVAPGDHTRALALRRALLDEGVERDDEESGEEREQHQVDRDADAARAREEGADDAQLAEPTQMAMQKRARNSVTTSSLTWRKSRL